MKRIIGTCATCGMIIEEGVDESDRFPDYHHSCVPMELMKGNIYPVDPLWMIYRSVTGSRPGRQTTLDVQEDRQ